MKQSENPISPISPDYSKDYFFSVVAHDLKSPLSTIVSLTDACSTNLDFFDRNTMEKMLTSISDEARNTLHLLDDMLEWYQVQNGNVQFNPGIQDMTDVVNEAVREVNGSARHKGITVNYDIRPVSVFADRTMLVIVLRNLLTNAIKFTRSGGRVWVEMEQGEQDIRFSVHDTGVGMSDSIVQQLFQSRKRLTSVGTNNEKGTGLGLLLCKEFVGQHGGRIWAESQPGQGSVFSFTLPMANNPEGSFSS